MNDFEPAHYTFSTVWSGFEQNTSIECDRCEPAVWERTGDSEGDSIDLDRFIELAREHEREVHGG